MKTFSKAFNVILNEEPSRAGAFILGAFQVVLGLWLLLPPESFAPTKFNAADSKVFGSLQEWEFGIAMIVLGLLESYLSSKEKWAWLAHESIIAAMFWAFVTAGYVFAIPEATGVVVFGFLSVFSGYKYFMLCSYVRRNLRNKEYVGNI